VPFMYELRWVLAPPRAHGGHPSVTHPRRFLAASGVARNVDPEGRGARAPGSVYQYSLWLVVCWRPLRCECSWTTRARTRAWICPTG
jgi:hypothetical protein